MSVETFNKLVDDQEAAPAITEFSDIDVEFVDAKLALINERGATRSPDYIADWALDNFDPRKAVVMSSGGFTAVGALDLLARRTEEKKIAMLPMLHNDTGMLDDRVNEYLHETLREAFGFEVITTGPDSDTLDDIVARELWRNDPNDFMNTNESEYRRLTKYGPIDEAVAKYAWQVMFTGVRKDQTQNRDELAIITKGSAGELRVNPNFLLTRADVGRMMPEINQRRGLVPNPLEIDESLKGIVTFIDDWPFVGGPKNECGIHSAKRLVTFPRFAFERLVAAELPVAA